MRLTPKLRRDERGFTLIELLIVLVIIGVLLAIAVPSYMAFRQRAADNSARANLRGALPAAEAYFVNGNTYVGLTTPVLRAIDTGISPTLTVVATTATTYCLAETVAGRTWSVDGPGAQPTDYVNNGTCA